MKTVCEKNSCTGCMACKEVCLHNAIDVRDEMSAYNSYIDTDKCINCNACYSVCQHKQLLELHSPLKWYQGWSKDPDIRMNSSSGGIATAISVAFVKKGGFVCSCKFDDGDFVFILTNKEEEVKKFYGSKYIKSNPTGAYREVKDKLKQGNRVLFIGLPCQVAAMKNFLGKQYVGQLFTIDLICHGTPTPRLLIHFLGQYGIALNKVKNIAFRERNVYGIKVDGVNKHLNGGLDSYMLAFLNALSCTDCCYNCRYAQIKRCGDLTLGDSWGSDLSKEEQKQGISLILCQTKKGEELLSTIDAYLFDVDIENAKLFNHQLVRPTNIPPQRTLFWRGIKRNRRFDYMVFRAYKIQYLKQRLKTILIAIDNMK